MQAILTYIDDQITSELTAPRLAEKAGYSLFYFSRIFTKTIGIPPMTYVTWRKLQYALYDLSLGKKVIDVAMEYGFETHSGFTKAFVHWFGFPPSMCRMISRVHLPASMNVTMLQNKFNGGNAMNPHIIELTPFSVVGYPKRYQKDNMKSAADAPVFWDTIGLDYEPLLTKLHDTFTRSKHFEISICYDIDEETGEFTYLLGRGIDQPDDFAHLESDMTRLDLTGGLYAIFSTPPANDPDFADTIRKTWDEIFLTWLSQAEFEFDDSRDAFDYHDYRNHGWYFNGKLQMDICIPIRQKEEEIRKSQLRIQS